MASEDLPVARFKQAIIDSVARFATTVMVGETGSGKSTQIAQYLADASFSSSAKGRRRRVVCTQPRRVAAITIARRVAEERKVKLGEEVGYSIRFDDVTSPSTRIKYVTDGVLLRECMTDAKLSAYDVVILDESHERSLQTDILMGLLKTLQLERPNLRLVVMSATLEVDLFMTFFHQSHFVAVPGRQFPVDIYYTLEPEADFLDAALLTCLQIHAEEEAGGVLVFLPGQEDIENLVHMLEEHLPSILSKQMRQRSMEKTALNSDSKQALVDFCIYPLYAALSQEEQLRAFAPSVSGVRKFVVATNIAETSLTIAGIKYVVDTGYNKCRSVSLRGLETLKVSPVSQSQANQRSGRAGREAAGKCFRLYTEDAFERLEVSTVPEIRRVNISQVVLQLKVLGVKSPETFPFPSPPTTDGLHRAINLLGALGALDKEKALTPLGSKMSKLPLDPTLALLVLKSPSYGCVQEAVAAVAMLSTDNVFLLPHKEELKQQAALAHKRFATKDGDLPTLVSIYFAWNKTGRDKSWARTQFLNQRALLHAAEVFKQLTGLLHGLGIDTSLSCLPEKTPFLKCIAAAFFLNAAKRNVTSVFTKGGSKSHLLSSSGSRPLQSPEQSAPYKAMWGGELVHVHPSSVLFSIAGGERRLPGCVVFAEILITSKQYMRCITAIEESWLVEAAPNFYKLAT